MFVGRNNEIEKLKLLFQKKTSSLVVCRGRRRIGKSTLIQNFGKTASIFIEFQGIAPGKRIDTKVQLEAFSSQLSRQTKVPKVGLQDWDQAFSLLAGIITKEKTVVLFDEISWMAKGSPTFSAVLKAAWDMELKKHPNLILVLCGSVSSWIDKNILFNTGFVGRVSLTLNIKELSLPYCKLFWGNRINRVSDFEKLKILAITGGVPKYLEEINPRQSAEENIRRLCFDKDGLLFLEFERIFNVIFERRAKTYKNILHALIDNPKGVSEICEKLNIIKGGSTIQYLNDLIKSGFVTKDVKYSLKTGKLTKQVRYRVNDNYIRFYLKYIEPNADNIEKDIYHNSSIGNIIAWDTILGFQFENLVLNNLPLLCQNLGINTESVISMAPYFQKQNKNNKGFQIDLLIQTRSALYPCEIKFRLKIDTSVLNDVKRKISYLPINQLTSIRPVLIYAGKLENSVIREDYFDRVVSFTDLLNHDSF